MPERPLLRPGVPRAAVLALACTCAFMVVLDTSIVNVALPSMRAALSLSRSTQQWVVDAYLLTLGGLLLLGARASDLYGRRRVLMVGIVIFVAGSLGGGLAGSGAEILTARAIQGVGGSVLAPSGLSLIIATYPEGDDRGKAMSLYAACAAVAVTIGVLVGGFLTQELSWRWVMFINVPVGVGLFVAVVELLNPVEHETNRRRLDAAGAVTVTTGIAALIEGLSNAQRNGWASSLTLASLVAGSILIVAFILIEREHEDPLVRLSVFRLPGVVGGNLIVACNGVVLTGSTFFVSQVLQNGLGFDALGAGLRLAPFAVTSGVVALLSARLVEQFGPRRVLLAGLTLAASGYVWIGLPGDRPSYAASLLGPLVVIGAGIGMTTMPSTRAAAAGVSAKDAGLAAGLFNVSRQIGAAIGIAALATLAVAHAHAELHGGAPPATAALRGDSAALLACAGVCGLSAVISLTIPQRKRDTRIAAGSDD